MENRGNNGSPAFLRLIIDHNPFFLLSAVCMMVGCYILNIALYTPAGDVHKQLLLLGVINVYEAALIGLALALLRRGSLERRDAHTLLGLEALFLVDTAFVSGVISTIDPQWGWMVNGTLLVLAMLKVGIVAKALRLAAAGRIIILVMVQMAVILLLPTVLKQVAMSHRGFLPEHVVYLSWWVAGLMPVVAAVLFWPGRGAGAREAAATESGLAGIYLVAAFLSVLVHVYGAGWVYNHYLAAAEVSPVLLGFAVALSALRAHRPGVRVVNWQVGLIFAAVLCALYGDLTPSKVSVRSSISFTFLSVQVTAVRMTLVGAALVVLHIIYQHRVLYAVIAAAAGGTGAVLWPNRQAIWGAIVDLAHGVGALLDRLVPKTTAQWGIVAVVTSFILLVAGAFFSFRRRPPPQQQGMELARIMPPAPEDNAGAEAIVEVAQPPHDDVG